MSNTPAPQWSPGLMAGGSSHVPADSGNASHPPQWSPGLMAGGRSGTVVFDVTGVTRPQWSPGLMAGGRDRAITEHRPGHRAAMEPRPDGRGKCRFVLPALDATWPQWSPGLMAGGRASGQRAM